MTNLWFIGQGQTEKVTEVGGLIHPYTFSCGKRKGENNIGRSLQNRNPLYPKVRIIKLNCCPSVKDINTSEEFIVWSNSCQGAQYPDTDESGQTCYRLFRFLLKDLLGPSDPLAHVSAVFFTFRTVINLRPTPFLTLSVPYKKAHPPLFLCFRWSPFLGSYVDLGTKSKTVPGTCVSGSSNLFVFVR